MLLGCDASASESVSTLITTTSHTRGVHVLVNKYSDDVAACDSTITISPEHEKHVPTRLDLSLGGELMDNFAALVTIDWSDSKHDIRLVGNIVPVIGGGRIMLPFDLTTVTMSRAVNQCAEAGTVKRARPSGSVR